MLERPEVPESPRHSLSCPLRKVTGLREWQPWVPIPGLPFSSCPISLSLAFLFCKMGVTPTPRGCHGSPIKWKARTERWCYRSRQQPGEDGRSPPRSQRSARSRDRPALRPQRGLAPGHVLGASHTLTHGACQRPWEARATDILRCQDGNRGREGKGARPRPAPRCLAQGHSPSLLTYVTGGFGCFREQTHRKRKDY